MSQLTRSSPVLGWQGTVDTMWPDTKGRWMLLAKHCAQTCSFMWISSSKQVCLYVLTQRHYSSKKCCVQSCPKEPPPCSHTRMVAEKSNLQLSYCFSWFPWGFPFAWLCYRHVQENQKWDKCDQELDNLQRRLAEFCSARRKGRRKIKERCKAQAQKIAGVPFENDLPNSTFHSGNEWQDAVLDSKLRAHKTPVFWAGFWPGGEEGIDTRQALADFISSVNGFQLADTGWGQAAEASDVHNLKNCAWDRKKNFWITASEDMAKSMSRNEVPRIIIALHKSLGGDYSFSNSILFKAELQSMGLEMRNTPDWNPQFVLHSIPINGSEQSSGCALRSEVEFRLKKYAKRRVTVFCKTCKTLEDCGPPNDLQKEIYHCKTRGGDCKNNQEVVVTLKQHSATYWNKDTYRGEFKNGKQDGKGTYTWANGDRYEGEFKNGFEDGKGTFTWADGDKYEGEWKDGLRHGKGTLTLANNIEYVGVWEKGQKISKEKLDMAQWKDLGEAVKVNPQRHGKRGKGGKSNGKNWGTLRVVLNKASALQLHVFRWLDLSTYFYWLETCAASDPWDSWNLASRTEASIDNWHTGLFPSNFVLRIVFTEWICFLHSLGSSGSASCGWYPVSATAQPTVFVCTFCTYTSCCFSVDLTTVGERVNLGVDFGVRNLTLWLNM